MSKRYIACVILLLFLSGCSTKNEINSPNTNDLKTYYPITGVEPEISAWIPNSDYVFYFTRATLPALYIALNMFTHTKESFLYLERQATYDSSYLPAHVQMLALGASYEDAVQIFKNKVKELQASHPNATYTFFVDDIRAELIVSLFFENGVSKDNVLLRLLSDGTQTYMTFKKSYGAADSDIAWNSDIEAISNVYQQYKKIGGGGEYLSDSWCYSFPVIPFVSQDAVLVLQWPELLSTKSLSLFENLSIQQNKNFWKLNPYKLYSALPATEQKLLKNMLKLTQTYPELGGKTIEEALTGTGKSNIIITGKNPYGDKTDQYTTLVKKYYGSGYAYFFKAHPAWHESPPDVITLPGVLPMEAILWFYSDKISVIGGYASSLYMTTSTDLKKFFFYNKANDMYLPLPEMYERGLLGKDVIFLNDLKFLGILNKVMEKFDKKDKGR